ncbi:hypothetical protein [Pseudodonghicola flavimaris]|uniref:Dihydroorotate dehydrogenase n=1 Tax=Pseudodonghicola flavimaris TaxID=3050036 RepID=A0ABT7F4K9_9RHOB|nr:hypothetical protein [Pseudodonghicola flavimaris]MDK3019538.1 hypothetical protein [Pseudodonghicola flavimaris]
MTDKQRQDVGLDGFFAAARRDRDTMPVGLAERMRADAAMVQAGFARAAAPVPAQGDGLLGQLWRALGGWPALSGMAAACAAGVWIGVAPPTFLPDPLGLVTQAQEQADVNVLDGYTLSTLIQEDG